MLLSWLGSRWFVVRLLVLMLLKPIAITIRLTLGLVFGSLDSCVDAGWNAIGVDFGIADSVVKGWTATVISWIHKIVCTFIHLRNSIGWVQLRMIGVVDG